MSRMFFRSSLSAGCLKLAAFRQNFVRPASYKHQICCVLHRGGFLAPNYYCTVSSEKRSLNAKHARIYTIPNLLCLARVGLSPIIAFSVLQEQCILSLCLVTIAGLTDLADGFIARKFKNQQSNLGSYLDPLADKILIGSLVASLTWVGLLPMYLTAVVLSRDALLISGALWLRYKNIPEPRNFNRLFDTSLEIPQVNPSPLSKFNTFVQLVSIGVAMGSPLIGFVGHPHLDRLWYLAIATTTLSGLDYAVKYRKILRRA